MTPDVNSDRIFVLPDLGEGLMDAEVVAWHVGPGDHVVADQPLASVETDKAVVEIPSPRSGRIGELLAPLHARIPVGAPLVAFESGADHDAGTVVGDLTVPPPSPPPSATPSPRPPAAPAIRALAKSLGVDLAALTGTGPAGTITRSDVQRTVASGGSADGAGMEPLRGVRRAMALRMADAGAAVVPATVTDEADIEVWASDTQVTARLIAAMAEACRTEPALNASYDGVTMERRLNTPVHVGIAVDTRDGLLVPVLRDAEQMDLTTLSAALEKLEDDVRSRRIAREALRGATITLSNFGAIGGHFAALVVVPPQVAILGAGRILRRVVADPGGFAAHRMLPLSLTFDHRAVSGGEAARFLAAVKAHLERGT